MKLEYNILFNAPLAGRPVHVIEEGTILLERNLMQRHEMPFNELISEINDIHRIYFNNEKPNITIKFSHLFSLEERHELQGKEEIAQKCNLIVAQELLRPAAAQQGPDNMEDDEDSMDIG